LTTFLDFFGRPMAAGIRRHEVILKMGGQSFRKSVFDLCPKGQQD